MDFNRGVKKKIYWVGTLDLMRYLVWFMSSTKATW
jgi:hypothetical protein